MRATRAKRAILRLGRSITISTQNVAVVLRPISLNQAQVYLPASEIAGWERPIWQAIIAHDATVQIDDPVDSGDFEGHVRFVMNQYINQELVSKLVLIEQSPTLSSPPG